VKISWEKVKTIGEIKRWYQRHLRKEEKGRKKKYFLHGKENGRKRTRSIVDTANPKTSPRQGRRGGTCSSRGGGKKKKVKKMHKKSDKQLEQRRLDEPCQKRKRGETFGGTWEKSKKCYIEVGGV